MALELHGHYVVLGGTLPEQLTLEEMGEELATWNHKHVSSQSVQDAAFGYGFENRTRNTWRFQHCDSLCDNLIKQAQAFLNEKAPFKVCILEDTMLQT